MSAGHIFLVGFMGAGKTTVAHLLSERLGRPCFDLDEMIEQRAGRTVRQIFESDGEHAFRDIESEALRSTVELDRAVIACGGGVVLRPENRVYLAEHGTVVYLQVTAGEALARVGDAASRPLLAGAGGRIAATSLLRAREALYTSSADITVDTMGKSPEAVVDELFGLLGQAEGGAGARD